MKTNMTHKILVLISKEANKRGYETVLTYSYDKWWLTISRAGTGTISRAGTGMLIIGNETQIGDIDEWMGEPQ